MSRAGAANCKRPQLIRRALFPPDGAQSDREMARALPTINVRIIFAINFNLARSLSLMRPRSAARGGREFRVRGFGGCKTLCWALSAAARRG